MKRKLSAIAIALAIALTFTGCGEQKKYEEAVSLMKEGKYEEAIAGFEEIIDYEDASDLINQCKYSKAVSLMEDGKYEEAIAGFEEITDYEDSADLIKQCKYSKAKGLYEDMDFQGALDVFNEIPDYEDASDYIEKCEYELSVDGQFMRALSNALVERWNYIDSDEALTEDYDNVQEKSCDIEIDALESFYDQTFNDTNLQEIAKDYIDTVKAAKDALTYYTVNVTKYSTDWDSAYQQRTILLEQLVNDYNLAVDETHQQTLDDLLTDAQASKEQVKLDEQVNEILRTINITSTTDEWGFVTYNFTMENTSEYTFDSFWVTVNAEDANNTIISSGSLLAPDNWAPGKKVSGTTSFYPDIDLNSVTLSYDVSYTSGGFYSM